MDQIHIFLYRLGNPYALLQIIAAVKQLRAAHAELDGEHGAYRFPDSFKDTDGKSHSVLEGASVFVCSVVEIRGDKLVQKPGMAAVNHNHLKTGPFGQRRGFSITGYDVVDLLYGQGSHLFAVRAHAVAGAVLGQGLLFILVCHISARILAGMRKFHAGNSAVPADRIGAEGKAGQGANGL